MKILQICNKPPFPPVDGGAIAMNNTTLALLNKGVDVKVLSISTQKHPVEISKIPLDYINKTRFEHVFIDTSVKIKDAFFNLFTNKSYNIERFISTDFESKIKEILNKENFDVILIESLFITPYISEIKKNTTAKIILRAHNIEHKIWQRFSKNSSNFIKKYYLAMLAKRLKKYEVEVIKSIDGIIAMTNIDLLEFKKLGYKKTITSIPVGYEFTSENNQNLFHQAEKKSLFHIASMDWMPNVEGLDWLLNDVWDKVIAKNPDAKLYIAGRNMPQKYYEKQKKGIVVVGEVPDAKEFYKSKQIMLVPLKSGSGMRIKIIEGMALGKVIISTAIGAEGITCTHNENILIGKNANDFANLINQCISDESFCEKIGENSKQFIQNNYNNQTMGQKMIDFFKTIPQ